MAGLKRRDPESWQRLLDLYSPLIYCWCRRSDMRAADAADVLQEVFQAVWRGIGRFRHDRSGDTFRGWLRTITRNKIRDYFRRQADRPRASGGSAAYQRLMEVEADDSDSPVDRAALSSLLRQALQLIRAEFEDRTWKAFWRTIVPGQTPAEIGEQLGITPGAVRQAKYKVLRRLRQELGDQP